MSHAVAVPLAAAATPDSPLQIELRFLLRVSPAEAFDLVANRLPEWFGAIHSVAWDHARSTRGAGVAGPCSERVCDFAGKRLREVVRSYEDGRAYAYSVDLERSQLKMPMTGHLGTFEVEGRADGTAVTWRQYFRPRWFMPAWMLRWQLGSRTMRPAVEVLMHRHGGRWL